MRHISRIHVRASFVLCVIAAASVTRVARANPVHEWNALAAELTAANHDPATQAHTLALVQLAVHDALNAIDPRSASYAFRGAAPGASVAAAVATATHDTLVARIPAAAEAIEARYATAIAAVPAGAAKDEGISVGRQAAAAILDIRKADDLASAISKPYQLKLPAPGVYQPTPPFNIVLLGGVGDLAHFVPSDEDAFRSPPPPATATREYAVDYQEVKRVGRADSKHRSAHETETARFWYDVATKEWHLAAQAGLIQESADEWRSARVLALLSIAMFDAAVASIETKYAYEYWRPITAIQAGDADGNSETRGDASWEPLCVTPPFPEYNSTHAVTAAAAATVLASELGDAHTFTVQSPTLAGASRTFARYTTAAHEEALSRIYCGIHFRTAMLAGLKQGRAVAEHAVENVLQPRDCAQPPKETP